MYNKTTKTYEGFVSLADLVKLVVDASAAVDVKTLGSLTKLGEAIHVDVSASVTNVVNKSQNSPFIPVNQDADLVSVRFTGLWAGQLVHASYIANWHRLQPCWRTRSVAVPACTVFRW